MKATIAASPRAELAFTNLIYVHPKDYAMLTQLARSPVSARHGFSCSPQTGSFSPYQKNKG